MDSFEQQRNMIVGEKVDGHKSLGLGRPGRSLEMPKTEVVITILSISYGYPYGTRAGFEKLNSQKVSEICPLASSLPAGSKLGQVHGTSPGQARAGSLAALSPWKALGQLSSPYLPMVWSVTFLVRPS